MLIALIIGGLGVLGATISILVAYRLVPPLRLDSVSAAGARREALMLQETDLVEAIRAAERERREEIDALRFAERERREEIDSLRQVMLKQRIEIARLQTEDRRRRLEELHNDRRAQELELRRRRANHEARQFSELPVSSLLSGGETPVHS
jgi:hypothetical protein